jgi:hypothetical protein
MPQDSPSRHQDQFLVRFPDGLRDRIRDAAKESGRSMNAEIVHRLEKTFEAGTLMTREEFQALSDGLHAGIQDALTDPEAILGRGDTLFVLLDTNGMPISWAEIREHIAAINEAGGFNPVNQAVRVITPELESSSATNQRTAELARNYRALLAKKKP